MKLVGERRALAAIVLVFYALNYGLAPLNPGVPPAYHNALYALASVYGLAFFSLVAGYFWARWYALGVALYGVITSAVGIFRIGPEPILLFIGGTHLAATLMLWGDAMSGPYDGQSKWRERFHMDDSAVQRLGRAVIRAGVALPMVLLYALAPKGSMGLGVVALALATIGFAAVVRLRTWGVLALGAAGSLLVVAAALSPTLNSALGGALLISAATPFARPIARWLVA
jgi:hypothetical protein